jgi:hypothetical protein
MPAKMLNLNPGLKEITHSITGGALAAQGIIQSFLSYKAWLNQKFQVTGCHTRVRLPSALLSVTKYQEL